MELLVSTGRTEQNSSDKEMVTKWLCAFQLNDYVISGLTARFEPNPSWFTPMRGHIPLYLPSMVTSWPKVTPSAFEKISATAEQLMSFNISEPRSARDFALHRFSAGASRSNAADAVVDFVVALESLLLPYDRDSRHGDLSYRFRAHGAHYLARTKRDRAGVYKQLNELYGLRSRLVHGGEYPTLSDIQAGRITAEELARRGLSRALSEGFPKVETFKAMVLGA